MTAYLWVAAGGALGSMGRYFVGNLAARHLGQGFPFGTLAVNVAGALLIGVLMAALERWLPPSEPALRQFFGVGVLGGFTTFSAFSHEAVALFQRGDAPLAGLYVVASVVLCVGAVLLGMALVRWLPA